MTDYTTVLIALSTTYFTISSIVYAMRVFHRRNRNSGLFADDIVMTIAYILNCSVFIIVIMLALEGYGKPLTLAMSPSEQKIKTLYILLTAGFALGNAQLFLTKLSIAVTCYYFSKVSSTQLYQSMAKIALILQFCMLVAIIPPTIPCIPLSDLWSSDAVKHCQNFTALVLSLSGLSLVDNFLLLLTPLPVILELTSKSKTFRQSRIALWFLLFLGALVILGDCVEIAFSRGYMFQRETDPIGAHVKQVQSSLWFIFRNNIIFIVACLPQARATLSHLWSNFQGKPLVYPVDQDNMDRGSDRQIHEELDRVFDNFRRHANEKGSIVTSDVQTINTEAYSPKAFADGHVDTSNAVFAQTAKQHTTEPSSQSIQRLDRVEDVHDGNIWLASLPLPGQAAFLQRPDSMPCKEPFASHQSEWEELYPAEDVEIREFSEQFDTISALPFSLVSSQTLDHPGPLRDGRSALQKEYYDRMCQIRAQVRAQDPAAAAQQQVERDFRHPSGTLPLADMINRNTGTESCKTSQGPTNKLAGPSSSIDEL